LGLVCAVVHTRQFASASYIVERKNVYRKSRGCMMQLNVCMV
jgi:hypothetical protein